MRSRPPLTDEDVQDLLAKAAKALGDATAATVHGKTAIETARHSLWILQFGLTRAMEETRTPANEDEPAAPR